MVIKKTLETYLPFVIVFGSVFLLFIGLCIYFIWVCPAFIKDLQLDAKVSESDDDEGHTMTTEFNSENNIEYSS